MYPTRPLMESFTSSHALLAVLACVALGVLVALPSRAASDGDDDPAVERREVGNLRIEGVPEEIPERVSERLRQYQNTRSASFGGWMPDGEGLLISTRFGETSQVHVVRSPGAARRQITFFDEPVAGGAPSPDPEVNGFVFLRDVGGSEFYQIFFYDLATGESTLLTDGSSRHGGTLWSNDGDRFAFFTTRRNGRDWDIHVMRPDAETSTPVLEKGGVWFPVDWSPDDRRLLVGRYVSANETHPHVLDLESGELTPLHDVESGERAFYGSAVFTADGRGVYYVSDEDTPPGNEFRRLRIRDLETGATRVLTPDIDWNVESLELSDDGRRLAFTVNEEGYSRLYLLDTESETRREVTGLPHGLIGGLGFAPDGRLALSLETPTSTTDVYSLDAAGEELTRWTFSEIGGLDAQSFVAPELVRFPTFDEVDGEKRTIPTFVYRPRGEGPFPVVVDIHGGPESQERPRFNSWIQFLVNEMELAVVTPNVRGSAGYGKSYLLLDNGVLREDSVKDIGALLDWIDTRPDLDADRVAVYGGSYGGYMVLASMVHFADRLRAGVDIVGISNFVTFLENTQGYRRDLRRAEYGDERDPEMREHLTKISPTENADKIRDPLFVIQGLNDPRVPASESEQMVAEIRDHGGTVWYLLATDEGHGFSKKSNRDYQREAVTLFLQRFLLDAEDD